MKPTIDSNLEAVYRELQHEVNVLSLKWQICKELFSESQERVDILNQTAAGFFQVVWVTLRDDVFLGISRLSDPTRSAGKDNLTLSRLKEIPDRVSHTQFYEELESMVNATIELCAPFRTLRNQKLAHLDMAKALKLDTNPLPGITLGQIIDTIKSIQETMNCFTRYYFDTTVIYDELIQSGGTDRLVYHLQRSVELRNKELASKR